MKRGGFEGIGWDGKQDVCIRRAAGFDCYLSRGTKFERFALVDDFSNEGGWTAMKYWSSLRLADYDGDGRADVCARFMGGLRCLRSTATGFAPSVLIAGLSDATGWSDPTNYMTIRVGDVNGDGADDFCVRSNSGMRCYGLKNGAGFSMTGPEWSDAGGWDNPQYFQTLTLTDIDPDRRRDICGRGSAGLHCARATDSGFERITSLDAFSNAKSFGDVKYYSTLRLGTGVCKPELCSGFDDNCDGKIDDGRPSKMGLTRPKYAARLVEAVLPESAAAGSVVEAKVRFLNEGSSAWEAGKMKLEAVANDQALIAALRPVTGWVDSTVAATVSNATAPGAVGEWVFPIQVPQNASAFEKVLFVLSSPDGAIRCPAPDVTLSLGVTVEEPGNDGGDGGNGGNGDGGNGENGGNDSGGNGNDGGGDGNDGGGNGDGFEADIGFDIGEEDEESEPGRRVMTSVSSCSAVSAGTVGGSSIPGAGWAVLLMVGGLFWRRRNVRGLRASQVEFQDGLQVEEMVDMKSVSKASVVLCVLVCGVLVVASGCDGAKVVSSVEAAEEVEASDTFAQREAALLKQGHERAERINMMSSRLLAAYDSWQIEGVLMELLPDSDSPAHFAVKLRNNGEQVAWPLGNDVITNAVFVPPVSDGKDGVAEGVPSVVVRTPGGQLLHVDLEAGAAVEFDEHAGLMISAAQNGGRVAYMVGDMGEQLTLKVANVGGQGGVEVQGIDLASNSWSPAISPDGSQVVYVSSTDAGNARIVLQAVDGDSRVLVEDAQVFPTGPQPPFWTDAGILFAVEQGGVFLMDLKGNVIPQGTGADSLLIDYRTGRALNMGGETLELQKN